MAGFWLWWQARNEPSPALRASSESRVAIAVGDGADRADEMDGANLPALSKETDAGVPSVEAEVSTEDQVSLSSAMGEALRQPWALDEAAAALPQNVGVSHFAANPGQDLTARFLQDGGVRIESGKAGREWQGTLRLTGNAGLRPVRPAGVSPAGADDGRRDARHPRSLEGRAPIPHWQANGTRMERDAAPGLTEWYENKEEGFQHGFTVAQRPAGAASEGLTLTIALDGLRAERDAARPGDLRFMRKDTGGAVLGYQGLLAWDATGRALAAAMRPAPEGFSLSVNDAGAVYPVTIDPLLVSLEQAMDDPDGLANDYAGLHAALDGDTAVIGALNDDTPAGVNAGSVLIFQRTGTAWNLQAKLLNAAGAANDRFGVSVGISGNTVIVGADYDDENGATDNGSASIFVRSGTTWTQQGPKLAPGAAGAQAGRALAIDGNTVVIGGPSAFTSSGRAWVYVRSGTTWALQQTLQAATPQNNANFGFAVDIHGDRVIVGEPRRSSTVANHGQATIFQRSGTTWSLQRSFNSGSLQSGEQFGFAVAIHGNMALAGAPGTPSGWTGATPAHANSRGRAFWLRHNGSSWPTTPGQMPAPTLTDGAFFGFAVDVQGDVAAIGALGLDGNRGRVLLNTYRSNGTWVQQPHLQPAGLNAQAWFGTGVSISNGRVLAGAHGGGTTNAGRAFIFTVQGVDDTSANITGSFTAFDPDQGQSVILRNVPAASGIRMFVSGTLSRLDAVDVPLPTPPPANGVYFPISFDLRITAALTNTTDNVSVPLVNGGLTTFPLTMGAFTLDATGARIATSVSLTQTLTLTPQNHALILPGKNYRIVVSYEITAPGAPSLTSTTLNNQRFISLSGKMMFGNVATTITAVSNNPASGSPVVQSPGVFLVNVGVPANAGHVTATPALTFGTGGSTLVFRYEGNAGATHGDLALNGAGGVTLPAPAGGTTAGVKWSPGQVFLGAGGATAQNFRVDLPTGFGCATNANTRIYKRSLTGSVTLTPQLTPTGTATFTPPAPATSFWLTHERLPNKMQVSQLVWNVSAGTFSPNATTTTRHVRIDATVQLASLGVTHGSNMTDGDTGHRLSNDNYLNGNGTMQNLVIKASPEGRALLSGQAQNSYSGCSPHFPKGFQINSGTTNVTWVDSQITTGTVTANGGTQTVAYATVAESSPGCALSGAGTEKTASFTATGGQWKVTPDGGLRAEGNVASTDIQWGRDTNGQYAHTVQGVTRGILLIAGYSLSGSAYPDLPKNDEQGSTYLPAAMLLSGHGSPANAALVERYGSKNYDAGLSTSTQAEILAAGLADYPGLNIRANYGITGVLKARSRVADKPVPATGAYDLKPRSKYNLRMRGVTGVHEAVTAHVNPLAGFYNYQMSLNLFGLAYRDCENVESTITGQVTLPEPTGIGLTFGDLRLSPTGHLERMTLTGVTSKNGGTPRLLYWDVPITASSMEFATLDECVSADRTLVLAVTAKMPAVTNEPMQARLGIEADGNLTTGGLVENKPTDSRFSLPATISLKTRADGTPENKGAYRFTPVTKAALNNPAAGAGGVPAKNVAAGGFVSMAGALDVPFFDDLQVHVTMTSSQAGGGTSSYYVKGGWKVDGKTFFNDAGFDKNNRGFPSGMTYEQYCNSVDRAYLPVAKRNWRGRVDLAYPLQWEPGARQFVSPADEKGEFLVLTVEHQIQQLTSRACSLTFGTSVGTPKLNLAALAAEGLAGEMTGALREALPDPELLLKGVDELEKLLTDRFERTLDNALNAALDAPNGPVDKLFDALDDYYDNNVVNGRRSFNGLPLNQLNAGLTDLTGKIKAMADEGSRFAADIDNALGTAIVSCNKARDVIRTRENIKKVVTKLSKIKSGGVAREITNVSNDIMAQSEEALVQAERLLDEVIARLEAMRTATSQVNGYMKQIRDAFDKLGADGLGGNAVTAALQQVVASYTGAQDLTGNYMAEFSPAQHKARIKAIIRQHISGSKLAAQVQPILRGAFTEVRKTFRTAVDQVFAEINRILANAVKEAGLAVADAFTHMAGKTEGSDEDSAQAIASGAGKVGDFGMTAQARGYARITDEEIEFFRIDVMMKLNVMVEVEAAAYFEMRNCNASTPNTSCRPAGAVATEVSLGVAARGKFGKHAVDVKMDGRFSFDEQMKLIGLDGSFDLKANLPFKDFSVSHMAAKFGFGSGVGFISGAVEGEIYFAAVKASCFFGFSKNPADFNLIDEDTKKVMDIPIPMVPGTVFPMPQVTCLDYALTGFYVGYDADVSVNEIFGIPDSCMLRLTGHLRGGSFLFHQKRGDRHYLMPGLRYGFGLSGDILCVVDLSGILTAVVKVELDVTDSLVKILSNPASILDNPVENVLNTLNSAKATGYGKVEFDVGVLGFDVASVTLSVWLTLSKDDLDVSFDAR